MLAKHPVKGAARTVTLEQLADFLDSWVPSKLIKVSSRTCGSCSRVTIFLF